jgi:hypothetical protein
MEDISNIQRILLNMKYDSKYTLTENYNKVLLNEDAQMSESGIERYWNAFNDRLKAAGYPTKKIGENQSWVGSFIFYKVGDALATITLKNGTVCSFKQDSWGNLYAGQTLDLVKGSDNCKTSQQNNLLGWLGYYSVQTGYKTPAAAPVTTSSGGGGTASIGNNMAPYDGEPDRYWKALKTRLVAWGIPEGTLKDAVDTTANAKPTYYKGMFVFYSNSSNSTIASYTTSQGTTVNAKISKPYNGVTLESVSITSDGIDGSTNLKEWLDWYNDISIKQHKTGLKGSSVTSTGGGGTSTGGSATPATPKAPATKVEVKPCSGTFKQGCKDGGGDTTIAKVQKCLLDKGMYKTKSGNPARVDGDFGSGTLAGIKQLLGKDTFTAEEVDTKICGPGAQTPPGVSTGGGGQNTGEQPSDDRETVGGQ